MRSYSKVSSMFWIGETGRKLRDEGPETIIVAMYLLTSPHANMLGLYYCPITYISHETGLTFQGASKGLARAIDGGFCTYDHDSEVVWVYEMAKFQIEDHLKENDKRVAGINKDYQKLPKCTFLYDFYEKYRDAFWLKNPRGLEGASKPHRSQEQEQEQEQDRKVSNDTLSGKDMPDGDAPPVTPAKRIPFKEIISLLNTPLGTAYKDTSQATRSKIKARFREGFRLEDFKAVIEHKVEEWGGDDKMTKFLRPETLFGNKFESYLNAARLEGAAPAGGPKSRWEPRN